MVPIVFPMLVGYVCVFFCWTVFVYVMRIRVLLNEHGFPFAASVLPILLIAFSCLTPDHAHTYTHTNARIYIFVNLFPSRAATAKWWIVHFIIIIWCAQEFLYCMHVYWQTGNVWKCLIDMCTCTHACRRNARISCWQ